MQKARRPLSCTTALLSPLVLFALLSFTLGQQVSVDSKHPIAIHGSDREVTLRLLTSDGREIVVSEYDGDMIRTGPKGGEILGITPRIQVDGSITLDFSRINKIIRKSAIVGEMITGIGTMVLDVGLPQSTPIGLVSSVQIVSIAEPSGTSGVVIQNAPPCPCCVSCGDEETCGLTVTLSCGSCSCR